MPANGKTKKMIEDLYDRVGYLGIGIAVGLGLLGIGIIAIIVVASIDLEENLDHTDISGSSRCNDFNPCTKDDCVDHYCVRGLEMMNGHDCSDWACLTDDGDGECLYNTFTMKSECKGDCAGTCFISGGECPEVPFKSTSPSPSIECDSRVCIYTLDLSSEHLFFEIVRDNGNILYTSSVSNE